MYYRGWEKYSDSAMISKGEIFVDNDGIDVSKIEINRRNEVIDDFCDMRDAAMKNGDKFFRQKSEQWDTFYCHIWGDPFFDGVDENHIQMLQTTFTNTIQIINDYNSFCSNNLQTRGGFDYEGHPLNNYIFNLKTWQLWHDEWFSIHQNLIDWKNIDEECVFPCLDRIIDILREELKKDPTGVYANHDDRNSLRETVDRMNNDEVAKVFEENVLKKMSGTGRIISYTIEIGDVICRANHYREEPELAKMEKVDGNRHVVKVYSIPRGGKLIFLSFDTKHGKFEVCDNNGNHIKEISFVGEKTGGGDSSHSLLTVEKWRRVYNR